MTSPGLLGLCLIIDSFTAKSFLNNKLTQERRHVIFRKTKRWSLPSNMSHYKTPIWWLFVKTTSCFSCLKSAEYSLVATVPLRRRDSRVLEKENVLTFCTLLGRGLPRAHLQSGLSRRLQILLNIKLNFYTSMRLHQKCFFCVMQEELRT